MSEEQVKKRFRIYTIILGNLFAAAAVFSVLTQCIIGFFVAFVCGIFAYYLLAPAGFEDMWQDLKDEIIEIYNDK